MEVGTCWYLSSFNIASQLANSFIYESHRFSYSCSGGSDCNCIEPMLLFFFCWPLEQGRYDDLKKALAFWMEQCQPCVRLSFYLLYYILLGIELDGPVGIAVFGDVTKDPLGVG